MLDAMNQFKPEIPAWVLKLEGDLKKEWEAENRKIKKSAGAMAGTKGAKTEAMQGAPAGLNVTG